MVKVLLTFAGSNKRATLADSFATTDAWLDAIWTVFPALKGFNLKLQYKYFSNPAILIDIDNTNDWSQAMSDLADHADASFDCIVTKLTKRLSGNPNSLPSYFEPKKRKPEDDADNSTLSSSKSSKIADGFGKDAKSRSSSSRGDDNSSSNSASASSGAARERSMSMEDTDMENEAGKEKKADGGSAAMELDDAKKDKGDSKDAKPSKVVQKMKKQSVRRTPSPRAS